MHLYALPYYNSDNYCNKHLQMAALNKKDGSKEDAIHNAVEDIRSGKCS